MVLGSQDGRLLALAGWILVGWVLAGWNGSFRSHPRYTFLIPNKEERVTQGETWLWTVSFVILWRMRMLNVDVNVNVDVNDGSCEE